MVHNGDGGDTAEVRRSWHWPAGADPVALCGACTRIRKCRLGIESETLGADGTVVYRLTCSESNEGGPGVAHGGWTAGVLDEMVGHVVLLHDQLAVTGTLQVVFVKPVPLEQPLVGRAWLDRKEGSRWFIQAVLELEASGAQLARASAVLVERDRGHFSRHQQWLRNELVKDKNGTS